MKRAVSSKIPAIKTPYMIYIKGLSLNANLLRTIECIDFSKSNTKMINPAIPISTGTMFMFDFL
jgi:hypothetical protein